MADAAGFTSKKAYEMGIPAIGIVAVLVANVAFVAWVQTPGAAAVLALQVSSVVRSGNNFKELLLLLLSCIACACVS